MASAAEVRPDGGGLQGEPVPSNCPAAASPSPLSSCGCAVELHPGVVRRVKVYELDEGEVWRERGTGQVQLYAECAEAVAARSLTVVVWPEGADGSADAPLLRHRVDASVEYGLQADTILSWTDAGDGRDWALSFQDAHRCHDVLEAIADHQKDAHSAAAAGDRPLLGSATNGTPSAAVQLRERRSDDRGDVSEGVCARQSPDGGDGTTSPAAALSPPGNASPDAPQPYADAVPGLVAASAEDWAAFLRRFPVPSQSSLELLQQRLLDSAGDPALRHVVLTLTTAAESPWLSSMYALTLRLEEAGDVDALQAVFALLVALINAVHDEQLIERLFDSAHALHTFAVLEYDPAIVARLRSTEALQLPLRRHTAALAASRCRWVLPPPPPPPQSSAEWASVERALHFHHRLAYAKDVVLLAHLDDAALSTFTSIAYIYRVSIVQQIHEDTTIVHQLAQAMRMHGQVRRWRAPAARHDDDDDADVHGGLGGDGSARPLDGLPSSSTATNGRSSHARSASSSAPSPTCRCDPARLLTLPDEAEEEPPSAGSAIVPTPSSSAASSSLFRARLHFLSDLLLLSKSLQPHLRSSFAESLIEHGVIDVLGSALQGKADAAEAVDEVEGDGDADGRGRRSRLSASVRCVRRLFPLALSVLSALLQHCPESFRSYFLECRAVQPRASVLSSALRLLALPRHVDAAICQQALAFMRALTDTEDEEAAADGAAASIGQGLLLDDLGALLAASLRRLAAHSRPHLCRVSSAGLLEWLTHAARKLSSHHVLAFMQREQVAHVVALFLTRSGEVEAVSSATPLSLPCHPREVLCAAVRLLSALLSLHEKALWALLVVADAFAALLRLLRSPLCRANLLQSAILDLFTAMAGQREHALPLLQHIASLQALTDGLPHERLFVDIRQRLQRHDSERAARQRDPAVTGRHRREERASHGPATHGSRKRKAHALHSPSASDSAAAAAPAAAASASGSGGRFPLRLGRVVDDAYFLDDDEDEDDAPRAAVKDARALPTTAAPHRQEDGSTADEEAGAAGDADDAFDAGHQWRHEAPHSRAGEERRHRQWHEQVDAAAHIAIPSSAPPTTVARPLRRVLTAASWARDCAALCALCVYDRRSTSTVRRRAPLHWAARWETTAGPMRRWRTPRRRQPIPSPPSWRASRRTSDSAPRSARRPRRSWTSGDASTAAGPRPPRPTPRRPRGLRRHLPSPLLRQRLPL